MNLFQRVWDSIGFNDRFDETEYEYEYEEMPPEFYPEANYPVEPRPVVGSNVVGMPHKAAQTEMCLMEPRSFEEMPTAVMALRERKSVILNLSLMNPDMAQRCVDFVAGAAFAIDGHQERLGEHIFLFTPSFVQISSYPSPATSTAQRAPGNPMTGPAVQPTQLTTPPTPSWTSYPPRMS